MTHGIDERKRWLALIVLCLGVLMIVPLGEPQSLHNAGRLAWGSGPRGEASEYMDLDVIIVRDGKIAALYVFLNAMPS